jgi:hypothetical protein
MSDSRFQSAPLQIRFSMPKRYFFFSLAVICVILAGCAFSKSPIYTGIRFPATDKVDITFQEKGVPAQCKAFSHIIVHTPSGITGEQIGHQITDFAKNKGANLILFGLSRKISWQRGNSCQFFPYGPKQEYLFSKGWLDWKYGFEDWEEGGRIVSFGYPNLSDTSINEFGMKIQMVLLRCGSSPP